jgi:TetR/AcrR family transcriptional regulator, regulator of cefoperazone and chloramphenicol sensitivity
VRAMANVIMPRGRPPVRRRGEDRQLTRTELLEAAGQVFAEKGFYRATGKEICERAGTNAAAVNYYFGGMEGLYAAVIEEAHSRLITLDRLSSLIAGKTDPRAKLQAIIERAVELLTGPVSSSWLLRVLGHEFVAPSSAVDRLIEREGVPKARILRSIVAEIMELPEDHPAVGRGCLNLLAPCAMLLIADRKTLRRALPALDLSREGAPALARHLLDYALAGLAAVARAARARG